jgi:hypothetical protein
MLKPLCKPRFQFKTNLIILLTSLGCAACAPAAARTPIQLQGTMSQLVSSSISICPRLSPTGYNYLSIENASANSVSCRAAVTSGVALLGVLTGLFSPDQRLNVSFIALSEQLIRVDISSFPRNTELEDQLETALRQEYLSAN